MNEYRAWRLYLNICTIPGTLCSHRALADPYGAHTRTPPFQTRFISELDLRPAVLGTVWGT